MTSEEELFTGFGPGFGTEWLENTFIPQSLAFYSEILPIVYQCSIASGQQPVQICDVGSASGAGPDLIARTQNHLLGWPAKVTCFDLDGRFKKYADVKFPSINYQVGDIFEAEGDFDIAVASHVVEHVPEPREFVSRLLERARFFCIIYVPFRENKLIPGHINRFDPEIIRNMPGMFWGRIMKSLGWRTEEGASVAAFVCATEMARKNLDIKKLTAALDSEYELTAI